MKRLRLGFWVLAMVVAGVAAGVAVAAPVNAPKSAPITIICGNTTYHGVVNGNGAWAPAHDLNSNSVLIPISFGVETDVFTDPSGNVFPSTNPPRAKGSSAPNGATLLNCSYTVGPLTFPDGSSFTASGTVTGFVTPASG
jgi:hypothetical protein